MGKFSSYKHTTTMGGGGGHSPWDPIPGRRMPGWTDPMYRFSLPVISKRETLLAKVLGASLSFWICWRFKHDWKTMLNHYEPDKVWVIPKDPMYSGGHEHISSH